MNFQKPICFHLQLFFFCLLFINDEFSLVVTRLNNDLFENSVLISILNVWCIYKFLAAVMNFNIIQLFHSESTPFICVVLIYLAITNWKKSNVSWVTYTNTVRVGKENELNLINYCQDHLSVVNGVSWSFRRDNVKLY